MATGLLCWGQLPASWRRGLALATGLAGIGFLLVAMTREGVRESPTMGSYLMGTPYVAAQVSASASLPYYVMTALCLLFAIVGVAAGDGLAEILRRRWMTTAVAVSTLFTVLRFGLEKAAAPAGWTWAIGVSWLAPIVGAYFALSLRDEGKGLRPLVLALVGYGFAARIPVAALYGLATWLRLGSHYDLTPVTHVRSPFQGQVYEFVPGSLRQLLDLAVIPQLTFWPIYTVLAGLVGAGLTWTIRQARRGAGVAAMRPPMAAAVGEER